jgi:plastocyanin
MSSIARITNNLRIVPRDADFLNRKLGSRGEIFYDSSTNTLRLYDGQITGGISLAKNDLTNVSNSIFLAKATAAGIGSGGAGGNFELSVAADDSTTRTITSGNTLQFVGSSGIATSSTINGEIVIENTQSNFSTIAVAGQTSIDALVPNDVLTVVAGSNITLTTSGSSITISSADGGASSNSFSTISVSGQSNVVADSATDVLTFISGTGISITTNATNDSITFSNSAVSFSTLTDSSNAALTVDKFYLPAMTMLVVTNSGASAYRFDQYGSTDNPTIYVITGTTVAFDLNATGHPFQIQTPGGVNYNTGLVHVTPTGEVSTGAAAQGKDSGTLYWKVPTDISGGYRYQCSAHAPMVGSITVKTINTL